MKFRSQQNQLPEVDLVPMMDVLMSVLTFFIIISMTLTGQQVMNITLPDAEGGSNPMTSEEGKKVPTLLVGLNAQRQLVMNNAPVPEAQVITSVQDFLVKNPAGVVILKADKGLTYNDVARVLELLRDIGGDRISLGISGS
ncbi:biopolymer transporter ExbD [Thermoleptolyngbya sichuanensis A183]|uniref:Biopolymer transporter ExbD n=1 Tax=Thermoleptolyngbya sichuanensis A183 TaxID=2737172 RepID=A0A6M8B2Y5_9CYAN|nr:MULTISPECIES: biopolymer transporter ExbD [Thermoleptolyngbya]QKD81154.1 biopolymer transporter ExbD [Thermoleptolyngbya sichuanensis A183]